MATKTVYNFANRASSLTKEDVTTRANTTKVYKQVAEELVNETLLTSLSSGEADSYVMATSKYPLSEQELQQQFQTLRQLTEERDYLRHIHNLKGSSLNVFFNDFIKHVYSNLSGATLQLVNGCKSFPDFHRVVSALESGERKDTIIKAANSYAAASGLKLPLMFWQDAEKVYTANTLRNEQEHGSVLESALYFVKKFQAIKSQGKLPGGAATTLAMARYAEKNYVALEAQRQERLDEEKRLFASVLDAAQP